MTRVVLLLALLWLATASSQPRSGCQAQYRCSDACSKLYTQCDASLSTLAGELDESECLIVCEEGIGAEAEDAQLWLDCVADSVCAGETAASEDRELRRYDITWCEQFGAFAFP